jgi:hypothetical protein
LGITSGGLLGSKLVLITILDYQLLQVGPLPPDATYKVIAEKEGYFLEEVNYFYYITFKLQKYIFFNLIIFYVFIP